MRWDNRSFAVTSEEGAPGDNRALLTIYAQCDVKGRSWEEAVGELIAPGVRKLKEATSNATKLSQPSRFSLKEFAKQKKRLQETGKPVRLSPDDELLHFVAQEIASEGRPSQTRRVGAVDPDEGKQISRCLRVHEAVGQLYRKGQLSMDY